MVGTKIYAYSALHTSIYKYTVIHNTRQAIPAGQNPSHPPLAGPQRRRSGPMTSTWRRGASGGRRPCAGMRSDSALTEVSVPDMLIHVMKESPQNNIRQGSIHIRVDFSRVCGGHTLPSGPDKVGRKKGAIHQPAPETDTVQSGQQSLNQPSASSPDIFPSPLLSQFFFPS